MMASAGCQNIDFRAHRFPDPTLESCQQEILEVEASHPTSVVYEEEEAQAMTRRRRR
jgi:hypothetical protein